MTGAYDFSDFIRRMGAILTPTIRRPGFTMTDLTQQFHPTGARRNIGHVNMDANDTSRFFAKSRLLVQSPLIDQPTEILLIVMESLSAHDLLRMAASHHRFCALIDENPHLAKNIIAKEKARLIDTFTNKLDFSNKDLAAAFRQFRRMMASPTTFLSDLENTFIDWISIFSRVYARRRKRNTIGTGALLSEQAIYNFCTSLEEIHKISHMDVDLSTQSDTVAYQYFVLVTQMFHEQIEIDEEELVKTIDAARKGSIFGEVGPMDEVVIWHDWLDSDDEEAGEEQVKYRIMVPVKDKRNMVSPPWNEAIEKALGTMPYLQGIKFCWSETKTQEGCDMLLNFTEASLLGVAVVLEETVLGVREDFAVDDVATVEEPTAAYMDDDEMPW